MRRIHVVALVALSSSGTESFVLLAGRGARRSTRPATATTLSSEERFAEELQRLPSAVDQLRAIDANDDGLGTTAPFAVVLATAAAKAARDYVAADSAREELRSLGVDVFAFLAGGSQISANWIVLV